MNDDPQRSPLVDDLVTAPEEETPRAAASAGADAEDRAPTAPRPGSYGWADDYLNHTPFVQMNEDLIRFACKFANLLTGDTQVSAALLRSLPRYGSYSKDEEAEILARIQKGDHTVLEEEPDFFDQQEIAGPFAQLYGYARGGGGPGRNPEASRAGIELLLERHKELVRMIPESLRNEMGNDFVWLTDTLAAAEARWATDNGQSVAIEGLAALAGVRPKTVANMVAKTLPTDEAGLVPAPAALAWLNTRKDFVPSWWQTWRDESSPAGGATPDAPALSDQAFMPVGNDGSAFLPSLARRSKKGVLRYAIGEKATPEYVEDYWEALDKLARMPTPRWRRPNPGGQGGWGLVTAQEGWRRYSRADLERMIEAARRGEEG